MKIIKKLFLLLLLLFLGAVIFGFGYYYAVTKNVALSPEKLLLNDKTITFYDENGEIVRNASTSFLRQTTLIEEIPEHTKNAFISIEDRRFYKHNGYDVKGILRASWNNLKARSFKEGASTISQQLIKNTHLTQEKTIKRKMKEFKLTKKLERTYSKSEILEKYLNTIYFGHSCFGITSAAEFYFGKTPSELTLADSAILAGLVKSPNNYSPFKNPERAQKRKQVVLQAMLKNEKINASEKESARNAPLPTQEASLQGARYIHFVFDELSILAEAYDFTVGGKMEISTYLDQALQKNVEEIAATHTQSDKSILVLDGKTRGFKAGVSSIGNAQRLTGSLIKPLLVYTPAIEEDILSPATPILDEKVNYGGYAPENYDGKYHGYVSMRECVEKSLNIPAAKTLQSLTVDKGVEYMQKMGLPVNDEDKSLALALGGMKRGYSFKDMLSAYAALQSQGVYDTCGFISSVRINGKQVYQKPSSPQRVFSEESAYLMTDILQGTAKQGTAKKLRTLPFEIAAKTGTVGTKAGNTDAYALSYTSSDCVGVWLGNADNTKIDYTGGGEPCNLLYKINEEIYEQYQRQNKKITPFTKSENATWVDLDKESYYDTHTLRLADDIAPQEYRVKALFKKSALPLNKSTSFSNPAISTPTLSLKNKQVTITFDERSPRYYRYKIERHDYTTHTTLYEGEFLPSFTDSISENQTYRYTVTPYYQDRAGEKITLPTVTTKQGEKPKEEILFKEWWEY